jgi:hypothetical protein
MPYPFFCEVGARAGSRAAAPLPSDATLMNEPADEKQPAPAEEATGTAMGAGNADVSASSSSSDGMRRRRRRRRRRSVDTGNTPTTRMHLILLGIIGVLLVLSVLGPGYRRQAIASVRHLIPNVAVDISRRMEIVALIVAGLILVYLTPGVEDRVLRALGLRKDKRGGRR